VDAASRGVRTAAGVADASWIDRRIGPDRRAAFLYSSDFDPHALWQTEFWNRSVGRVLALDGGEPGGLRRTVVAVDERTGQLSPRVDAPRYVVTRGNVVVAGRREAERGPWRLYRVEPPLRLESVVEGVEPDGWMGREATYTAYGPTSSVEVVVSRRAWSGPDVPGHVRIQAGSMHRTGVLHSLGALRFVVLVPTRPFRLRVTVEPTFSPAQFGYPDTRQLGAVLSVRELGGT
jgi:hypothetical protein